MLTTITDEYTIKEHDMDMSEVKTISIGSVFLKFEEGKLKMRSYGNDGICVRNRCLSEVEEKKLLSNNKE